MAMVCLCHGISERKLAKVIDHGASTVDDVGRACRAGTDCGGCVRTIEAALAERTAAAAPLGTPARRPSFAPA